MDEIKRVLPALQTSDANNCAMTEREASDYEMTDFYLAKRVL